MALEPFEAVDFVQLAAEKGVNVFHQAPFARTVLEATHHLDAFDRSAGELVIERSWQSNPVLRSPQVVESVIGWLAEEEP